MLAGDVAGGGPLPHEENEERRLAHSTHGGGPGGEAQTGVTSRRGHPQALRAPAGAHQQPLHGHERHDPAARAARAGAPEVSAIFVIKAWKHRFYEVKKYTEKLLPRKFKVRIKIKIFYLDYTIL